MSYCGLAEPNNEPLMVFSLRVRSMPGQCTVNFAGLESPTITTWPPLPMEPIAADTTSSSTVPTVTIAASAP
ncbi:Uncharacterised protein [Mycobacteroides abscessus subsp. abscessus]|nr:Uncharacterised protein [Mycobacteroides abscessus subsp. abscessus]